MKLRVAMVLLITACGSGVNLRWDNSFVLPPLADGTEHPGLAGPVAGIIGDRLVVGGGANFPNGMPWDGGAKHYGKEAYVFEIGQDGLRWIRTETWPTAVAYPGNCSDGESVFIAGGENSEGPVSTVVRLSMKRDSLLADSLPALPVPLTNGGLVTASGKLYFVGGENADLVSDKIYALDPAGVAWEEAFRLPYPVSHAVVVSDGKDRLYVCGGRMRHAGAVSTLYDDVLEVKIQSGEFRKVATLPKASAAGTGVLDRDGNLLLFGGDTGETFHRVEDFLLRIRETADPGKQKELNEEKNRVQSGHPGFPSTVYRYNFTSGKWTQLASLPGESPVTTTALVYKDGIIIPSGEIRAGVRTNRILVGKYEDN